MLRRRFHSFRPEKSRRRQIVVTLGPRVANQSVLELHPVKLVRLASLAALAAVPALPAVAQDEDKWTGEGAFNAGFTTGNTETRDAGVALKARHTGGGWTQLGEFAFDYGDTDEVETRNRIFAAGQVDRLFSDQWSGYTRLSYERDQFSGFEDRYFLGVGAAFKAVDLPTTKWTLEGGPGYKIKCEINENKHLAGSLSMAHAGKDTGGSQFFICHKPQPHLDGVHTVFGRTHDMDVVNAIRKDDRILSVTVV